MKAFKRKVEEGWQIDIFIVLKCKQDEKYISNQKNKQCPKDVQDDIANS